MPFFSRKHSERTEDQGLPVHEPPASDKELGDGAARPRILQRQLTVHRTDAGALIPPSDKLLMFRALTGIDTVPIVASLGNGTPRTAPNVGIYSRVVKAERKVKRNHTIFSILINACLGIQILAAAILTALGAAKGSYTAITAFGAINTIVAAVQTYLKGSGLPNKLKSQANEWKVIREHIEQREREFCMTDCPLEVNEEVMIVEEMYKTTKSRLEALENPGSSTGNADANTSIVNRQSLQEGVKSFRQSWRESQAERLGKGRESMVPTVAEGLEEGGAGGGDRDNYEKQTNMS